MFNGNSISSPVRKEEVTCPSLMQGYRTRDFGFIWAQTTHKWTNACYRILIYTNYTDRVLCSDVSHIAISDHSLVYVYRKISSDLPSKGHSSISYRNVWDFDRENFWNETPQQDWSFSESEDPNLVWSNWKTKSLRVVNSHAPFQTRRTKLN